MENLPYDNLEELALVLQGVFFGDQLTVNKTQDTLTQMAKEPIRFTDALVRIITNETATRIFLYIPLTKPSIEEFNKIKKAACISLERKLAHLFDKKGSNADIRGYILETTVQAIYSNNVPSSIKPTLQKFLKIIYHNEDKEGLLKQKSMAYAIEKMGTNQVNDYAASLLLIKVIIEDPMNPNDIVARWFNASIERFIVAGNALIEGVRSEIVDVVKGDVQHDKLSHIFVG